MFFVVVFHGFIIPAAPHQSLFFHDFFKTLEKAWSCWFWIALGLSKLKFYLCGPHFTLASHHPLMSSFPNVYPSVHVCASAYVQSPRKGEFVFWVCVRVQVRSFVRLSHRVQSCSCVSRVDVLKWGHFLSVWCLRNNPTAQKLLQPSASTYLSLYLYCSGYAFLFYYCPPHTVW